MKVIDLLNKIANGEEVPEKIKYNNETFTIREEKDDYVSKNNWFTDRYCFLDLNEEVEIIEEDKKIERIDLSEWAEITYLEDWKMLTKDFNRNSNLFVDKINEIIDYINKE